MTSFSVIGSGRLGTALAFALSRRGWALAVLADRDAAAARESRRIIGRGVATTDIRRAARRSDVLFICVPDDEVEAVARFLSRCLADWSGRIVFHVSGLLPASVLDPLRRKGARAASLHPARSFPVKERSAARFRALCWALEGDREAVAEGRRIVKTLGGRSFVLAAENKALYHAACSLASNAFVTLEAAASFLLGEAGLGRRLILSVLFPLVQGTLQNVKELGPEKALTGPVIRGDVMTVRRHLEALRPFPLEAKIYRVLGIRALGLLSAKTIPAGKLRALRRLLEGRRPPLPAVRPSSRKRVP
jgi:predicted short-subunit dehydrogenase-like oxidoreductase (DUF2520 family)